MNQSKTLKDMFSSRVFPPLSNETLDIIESCYILDFDSTVEPRIELIVDFFCTSLPNFPDYATKMDEEEIKLRSRVIKLLRMTKHRIFPPQTAIEVEKELVFLTKTSGPLQLEAYCYIVDYYLHNKEAFNRPMVFELLNFIYGYINDAAQDLNEADYNTLTTFMSSLKYIIILVDPKQAVQNNVDFVHLYQIILNLIHSCLAHINAGDFFPKIERICSKTLKVFTKFLETANNMITPKIESEILSIKEKIPQRTEFFHIYEGFLMVCATLYSIPQSKFSNDFKEIVHNELILNFVNYAQKPLYGEQKLLNYLTCVKSGLTDFSDDVFIKRLLSNIYRLSTALGSIFTQKTNLYLLSDKMLLGSIYRSEKYKKNTFELNDVIDQCMALLELMFDQHYHNVDSWINLNFNALSMLHLVISLFLQKYKTEKDSRIDVLTRLTRYTAKIYEVFKEETERIRKGIENGQSPTFEQQHRIEKLKRILKLYFDILLKLPEGWTYTFFRRNMEYVELFVHSYIPLLKKLADPFAFLIVLVQSMIEMHDSLNRRFYDISAKMIEYSLVPDTDIKEKPGEVDELCDELVTALITSVNKNYTDIIEVVYYKLFNASARFMIKKKPCNLHKFTKLITSNSYYWMRILINHKNDLVYSRLGIHIYQNLDPPPINYIWVDIFLKALEEGDERKGDLISFSKVMNEKLFNVMKPIQKISILNSLTKILSKKNNNELYTLTNLLLHVQNIPDISIEKPQTTKKPELIIKYKGVPVVLQSYFNAFETSKSEDVQYLSELFLCGVNTLTFKEATTTKVMLDIFKYLVEKDKELLKELPDNYAGYIYRYLAFGDVDVPEEQQYDFLRESYFLYFNKDMIMPLLKLTDKYLNNIPFGDKWIELLAPLLQYPKEEAEYAIDILKRYIFSRKIESNDDLRILAKFSNISNNTIVKNPRVNYVLINEMRKRLEHDPHSPQKYKEYIEKIEAKIREGNLQYITSVYQILILTFDFRIIGSQTLFQTIIGFLKVHKLEDNPTMIKSRHLRPMIKMATEIPFFDRMSTPEGMRVDLFLSKRFILNLLSRILVGTTDPSQATERYSIAFELMHDKNYHSHISYFLKCLEESVNDGFGTFDLMPRDLRLLLRFETKCLSRTDLKILKFITKINLFYESSHLIVNYIRDTFILFRKGPGALNRRKVQFYAESLSEILYNLFKYEEENNVDDCIMEAINFAVFYRSLEVPIDVNFEKAVLAYPQQFVKAFSVLYQKDANFNTLLYLESLYTNKNLLPFTMTCIEGFYQEYSSIHSYFVRTRPNIAIEVFQRFLYATSLVVTNEKLETSAYYAISNLVVKLLSYFQREIGQFYKPSFLLPLMNILFPENIKNIIGDEEKLIAQILKESIKMVLHLPEIFHHTILLKRLGFVIAQFPTKSDEIMENFKEIAVNTITEITFYNQVLYYYRKIVPYDDENPMTCIIENNEVINSGNIFQKVIYEYSVARLSKLKNVSVLNLMQNSASILWCDIHESLILKGEMDLDSIISRARITKLFLRHKVDVESQFDEIVRTTPYTQGSKLLYNFTIVGHRTGINKKENIQHFFYNMGLNFFSPTPVPKMKFLEYYSYMKYIVADFNKFYCKQIYKHIIMAMSFYLENSPQPKDGLSSIKLFTGIINQVSEYAEPSEIPKAQRDVIRKFVTQKPPGDFFTMKAIYFFLPHVAKIIYYDEKENFCPPMLLISQFINKQPYDLFEHFIPAFRACARYGKEKVTTAVLTDFYNMHIKVRHITPPKGNPLSIVLKWSKEAEIYVATYVDLFVKALMPGNTEELNKQFDNIELPLNQNYIRCIISEIKLHPDVIESQRKQQRTGLAYTLPMIMKEQQKEFSPQEIVQNLWDNPWHSQNESAHIYIFAGFVLPYQISEIILYFEKDDLYLTLYKVITKLQKDYPHFNRFIQFYSKSFPQSTLTELFRLMPTLKDSLPLPYSSVIKNIEYFNDISLQVDAVGIAKSRLYKKDDLNLKIAGSYYQLSQYDTAKEYYEKAFDQDHDALPISYIMLRPILFNTCASVIKNDPEHHSEEFAVIRLFSPKPKFTCYIPDSRFNLPYAACIERLIAYDEARELKKNIQAIQSQLEVHQVPNGMGHQLGVDPKLASKLQALPSMCLDFNCSVISTLEFRIRELSRNSGRLILLQSLISINKNILSYLLQKTRSYRKAINLFTQSMRQQFSLEQIRKPPTNEIPIIPNGRTPQQQQAQRMLLQKQQAAKVAAAQFQDVRKGFTINELNIGRVYRMIEMFNTTQQTQQYMQGAAHGHNPPQFQNELLYKPLERTKVDYLIEMKDFKAVIEYFMPKPIDGKSMLDMIAYILMNRKTFSQSKAPMQGKTIIQGKNIFSILMKLIGQKDLDFYAISLILYTAKMFPELEEEFIRLLDHEMVQDKIILWMRFLPMLLLNFQSQNIEFYKKFIKTRGDFIRFFRATMKNVQASLGQLPASRQERQRKVIEDLNNVLQTQREWSKIREYDDSISWTLKCEEDINNYKKVLTMHLKLAEYFALNRELPEEMLKITGPDYISYLENNLPYFKTDFKLITNSMFSSFKIPNLNDFYHAEIIAPGDKDAFIEFMNCEGKKNRLMITCDRLYPISYQEMLFTICITKFIESHPSSKQRQKFINYSQVFYLHNNLVMVQKYGETLPMITQRNYIAELARIYANRDKENIDTKSPLSVIQRRGFFNDKENTDSQKKLFKWVTDGADGKIEDFIIMRQSICSNLAQISAIKLLFKSTFPMFPNFILNNDRLGIFTTNFTIYKKRVFHLPLTKTLSYLFPDYLMQGSFATTWQITMDSLAQNLKRVHIYTAGILSQLDFKNQEEEIAKSVCNRIVQLHTAESEDTDKENDPFPFALIDHLIETSPNAFNCQEIAFAWF